MNWFVASLRENPELAIFLTLALVGTVLLVLPHVVSVLTTQAVERMGGVG